MRRKPRFRRTSSLPGTASSSSCQRSRGRREASLHCAATELDRSSHCSEQWLFPFPGEPIRGTQGTVFPRRKSEESCRPAIHACDNLASQPTASVGGGCFAASLAAQTVTTLRWNNPNSGWSPIMRSSNKELRKASPIAWSPQRPPAFVLEVERFCQRWLASPTLGVEDMARVARLSRFHFSRKFKLVRGISPGQYLTGLRLERALRLLSAGVFSVKEVSAQCGYTDPNYFCKAFRQGLGISPGRLRLANTRTLVARPPLGVLGAALPRDSALQPATSNGLRQGSAQPGAMRARSRLWLDAGVPGMRTGTASAAARR
jgi:AraC-like DNA-binding protein